MVGVCISLLGAIMFALNPLNLSTFAILYTLGNVVAIASTLFLMGPMKQVPGCKVPHRTRRFKRLKSHK